MKRSNLVTGQRLGRDLCSRGEGARNRLSGAIQQIRVERTGHGLVRHRGRLITRQHASVVAGSGRDGWAIVGSGLAPVPLTSRSRCHREPLGAGSGFNTVREGTGAALADRPVVHSGDALIVDWHGQQQTYQAKPTPDG